MKLSVITESSPNDFYSHDESIQEAKKCDDKDIKSVVSIVKYNNLYLLGLSLHTDDRKGTWVFPGGQRKPKETIEKTSEREVKEETGASCTFKKMLNYDKKKGVKFCICTANSNRKLTPNNEFAALGWFSKKDLDSLKLYKNVKELINKA